MVIWNIFGVDWGWINWKGKRYYCNEDGIMVSNQVLTIYDSTFDNEVYAFTTDGHMLMQINGRGTLT